MHVTKEGLTIFLVFMMIVISLFTGAGVISTGDNLITFLTKLIFFKIPGAGGASFIFDFLSALTVLDIYVLVRS